jgi:hypothetical protein
MNELERRRQRDKFSEWKVRAMKTLTPMIAKFFSEKFSQDDAKRLGLIIFDLNNPYFDILDSQGKHLSEESIIAGRILLQIRVEDFIKEYKEKFGE